ncbi:MAG: hypothetical protein K2K86_00510, partial [Muribaculaceae bacterium]|nr:hypothetical protein [Muribaculaceae bacterium]
CGCRNETPVAIFCEGDGNIIEQCILGYVAIICGHSYTIKGCLNDKYFLYDTNVDFNGSYWEVGQFEILDSKVMFSNCCLTADNNHFRVLHDTNERYYLGPWMSIDTDSCRKRLVNMFKKFNLDIDRFNQIDDDRNDSKRFLGRGVSHRSTVEFQSSIRASQAGWGAAQPMASPLFNVGDGAKIIGIENIESPDGFAIQNAFSKENMPQIAKVPVARATWLPLINGNFADVKSDIIVPDTISITAKTDATSNLNANNTANEKKLGRDWNSDTFSNIRLRFLLDEQRRLYSREFNVLNTVVPKPGARIDVDIAADMTGQTYSNLKMELLFTRKAGRILNEYKMRQHFYRVMDADIVSLTQVTDSDGLKHDNIVAVHNNDFRIGLFQIIKSYFDKAEIENQTLRDHSDVKPIEPVEIEGYLPEPSEYALNDFFGNSYEPLPLISGDYVNVATRIQWIGENNVRAFMSALPQYGTWNDGDEIVLQTAAYRYFGGKWYQYITFRNGTLQPIDPDDSSVTIDPIKPIIP